MRPWSAQPDWLPRALTVAVSSAFFVFVGVHVRQWSHSSGVYRIRAIRALARVSAARAGIPVTLRACRRRQRGR